REFLALPITTAWIREEEEVALGGEQLQRKRRAGPSRTRVGSRSAVHHHDHRIALRRIVGLREHQPALDIETVILPFDALRLAPGGMRTVVGVRNLLPRAGAASPNLGRVVP